MQMSIEQEIQKEHPNNEEDNHDEHTHNKEGNNKCKYS